MEQRCALVVGWKGVPEAWRAARLEFQAGGSSDELMLADAGTDVPDEVVGDAHAQRSQFPDTRIETLAELVHSAFVLTPGQQRLLPGVEQGDGRQFLDKAPHTRLDVTSGGQHPADAICLVQGTQAFVVEPEVAQRPEQVLAWQPAAELGQAVGRPEVHQLTLAAGADQAEAADAGFSLAAELGGRDELHGRGIAAVERQEHELAFVVAQARVNPEIRVAFDTVEAAMRCQKMLQRRRSSPMRGVPHMG